MRKALEYASLFTLVAVVALRPLIAESYDSTGSPFTVALGAESDPRPIHTLVIDLLILFAFGGWAVSHALGRGAYRWTGLEWGIAVITVAAAASCFAAGNKRLAINGSIDWLCTAMMAVALSQLLNTAQHRRILLAAIIGSACAQSWQCIEQVWQFDETRDHYRTIREDFWARQGVELDSGQVEQFERRLEAREASGFLAHSNVAGSYLVLCGLTALGLCAERRRCARARGFLAVAGCTLVVAGIAVALALTQSRGAILSGVIALGLLAAVKWIGPLSTPRRRRLVVLAWTAFLFAVLALVGYGWRTDALPGSSLTFRWQYWTASLAMFLRHPWFGVGRENFGRHYTQYKSIESPEEISNPHNLFVQTACEWGILGLLGLTFMLVGWSQRATTMAASPLVGDEERRSAPPTRGGATVAWAIALGLVVTVGRLPLLGSTDPNFLYYSTVTAGVAWMVGFVATVGGPGTVVGRNMVRAWAIAGLCTFLLHDLINFAMFVPAMATTFFAILAYSLAGESREANQQATTSRYAPAAAALVFAIGLLGAGLIPVARCEHQLAAARKSSSNYFRAPLHGQPAWAEFQAAADADPFDPTPEVARAEWLLGVAETVPAERMAARRAAAEALGVAMQRDPSYIRLPRMRARLHLAIATDSGEKADYAAAIEDARRAIALYPTSPADHVALADMQAAAGKALSSRELLQEAAAGYAHALDLEARRPDWEELRRMRPAEITAIEHKLRQVRERLSEP